MRLLIVEDNDELAELLAKGLKTAGYDADRLSTVEEARAVLSTTFYAALILDLGLPDGDGLELLRELRQRDNPIPVLVLTARGAVASRPRPALGEALLREAGVANQHVFERHHAVKDRTT